MSAQSVNLNCDICGFESSTREVWGEFYYINNHLKTPVNRALGWCEQCSKFCPIEDFSNQISICEEIDSLIKYFKNDYSQKSVLLIGKKLREDRLFKLELIGVLNEQSKIISKRIGSEKCLNCGSTNVEILISDCLSRIDERIRHSTGSIRTGYIHPNCGGEIIATPSPLHIQMEFTPRYYRSDGTRES